MRDNSRAVRRRLGRTIKKLRRRQGLSQEALAEQIGMNTKHLGAVERGAVSAGVDILSAIADGLSVDITDLFGPRPGSPPRYTLTQEDFERWRQFAKSFEKYQRLGPD